MAKIRLRTKLLLSLIFTTSVLTGALLLIVRSYLRNHALTEIHQGLRTSVISFQQFAILRERELGQSAILLADLPNLRALMTTRDAATIQDASADLWHLTESDLFVLADPSGRVMAVHTSAPGFTPELAQAALSESLKQSVNRDWWLGGGRLYAIFLQPIYFGDAASNVVLGTLAVGFEVDHKLAQTVASVGTCQVAFRDGKDLVVSTLPADQQEELSKQEIQTTTLDALKASEIELSGEHYLVTSLVLAPSKGTPVTLAVLRSYDEATTFLRQLNRLLLAEGLIAILAGGWLIFVIATTFTQPLANLVKGVRALEQGDFAFPLTVHSRDEVADLTSAFDRMRKSLQKSQLDLLRAERLATIGRMASTISHDLRHPLTTILAYAEFQSEGNLEASQRSALYDEIRASVNRMAELISSLLEFSRGQEALQLVQGDINESLEHVVTSLRLRPEWKGIEISLSHSTAATGWFDFKKLDRAFYNLLQNACEAVPPASGIVRVATFLRGDEIEITVSDNGPGIATEIREEVFQPFVTYGKEGGTGLGLAVVQKIVRDHSGDVTIESSDLKGTTFKIVLPVHQNILSPR